MLLRELKNIMFSPEKEVIINKAFKMRGHNAVLASLSSQEGKNILWVLRDNPTNTCDEETPELITNRDQLEQRARTTVPNSFLKEASVQGQKISFHCSSGENFLYNNYRAFMRLQRLTDQGVDLSVFDDTELSNVSLTGYELNGELPFPAISPPFESDIVLTVAEEHLQKHIGKTYTLQLGESIEERLSFFDSENACERYFYINKLKRYDMWEEIDNEDLDKRFHEVGKQQDWDDERIASAITEYLAAMERVCPRGSDLITVEYETEDDIQLEFYEKEFLDKEPERINNSCTVAVFMSSDIKEGPHGFKQRICALHPIPKNIDVRLSIELFSWYMKIPKETIEV